VGLKVKEGKIWTVTRAKVKGIKADCETLHVLGAVTFKQDVQVKTVAVFGQAIFKGTVIADQLVNKGVCFVKDTCEIRHVKNIGQLQLNAGRVINVESSGYLKVEQKLESECLTVNGALSGREIMAKEFHCCLSANSSIQKLIANKIIIERSKGTFSLLKKKLKCERILGKTLSLSFTDANEVEGEEVFIGPRCTIHTLRYTKNYAIDPVSTVQHIIKIGEDI
jgi:cytoskeletal protein CcmA (bactofilin family)